jgi:hypothetical protein
MTIIYTSPCSMYRVIEENGLFYPQERRAWAAGWGRLFSQQEIDEFVATDHYTVSESPFEGWFLGRTCRGENKGFKSYKSAKSAIAFVDGCSEQMRAA